MKTLMIVKLGSTYPDLATQWGDFEDWVAAGLGPLPLPVQTIDPVHGDPLPNYDTLAGVVLTGSHAMVTDREPWSEQIGQWVVGLIPRNIPLLAICYGHQLLAHALGCPVADNPQGEEVGTVPLYLTPEAAEDPLFRSLPNPFLAQVFHTQSVLKLPPGAVLLAYSEKEPFHAVRVGRCAWGVQFHPEFDQEIALAYLRKSAEKLPPGSKRSDRLAVQISPTPKAASILGRFGPWCLSYLPGFQTL